VFAAWPTVAGLPTLGRGEIDIIRSAAHARWGTDPGIEGVLMTGPVLSWRDPATVDRCTDAVAAITRDIFTWHRRGVTVRMVEPCGDTGVRLGVCGVVGVREAQNLLTRHYGFPVVCYPWT